MKKKLKTFTTAICLIFLLIAVVNVQAADEVPSYEELLRNFKEGKFFKDENILSQLEKSCINSWPKVATRKGKSLVVNLGKAPITFEDIGQPGMESSRNFNFVYYFAKLNIALVYKGERTWESFFLLSNSDSIELMGPPILSPDGKWAFSFLSCEMNGNWFDLVKLEKNLASEEMSWSPEDFRKMGLTGFGAPRWIATNSIEILTKSILKDGVENYSPMRTVISFDSQTQKWTKTVASDSLSISKDDE